MLFSFPLCSGSEKSLLFLCMELVAVKRTNLLQHIAFGDVKHQIVHCLCKVLDVICSFVESVDC